MTLEEVGALRGGTRVLWTDPEGVSSRVVTIAAAQVIGTMVRITDTNNIQLECLPEELSLVEADQS